MALADRHPRYVLGMVAFQVQVFLALLVYGLWSPSLGSRILAPASVMTAVFAALIWMTLRRPWDPAWSFDREGGWFQRSWHFWDPALLVGGTLGIAQGYRGVFGDTKEFLTRYGSYMDARIMPSAVRAWNEDSFGLRLLEGGDFFGMVLIPLFALLLIWAFLPR